jgi:hypothetical protein
MLCSGFHDSLMFYSLETYGKEGGVSKDGIFGYLDRTSAYIHRLATQAEIYIYNKRGYLQITESEAITLYRDENAKRINTKLRW